MHAIHSLMYQVTTTTVAAGGAVAGGPKVSLHPNSTFIFGQALTNLVDGLGFYALIASLAGLVVGAGLWAVGSNSQNFSQTYNGKKAVLVSAAAALVLGAGPQLINAAFSIGGTPDQSINAQTGR